MGLVLGPEYAEITIEHEYNIIDSIENNSQNHPDSFSP